MLSLDQTWTSYDRQHQPVIVKLFPLTDERGVASYLERLEGEIGAAVTNGSRQYDATPNKGRMDQVIAKICRDFDLDAQQAMAARSDELRMPETVQ